MAAESTVKDLQHKIQELEEEISRCRSREKEPTIFHRLAEAAQYGFGLADMEGNITYINQALGRMLGEPTPYAAKGKNIAAYYPEPVGDRLIHEILPSVIRKGHWVGDLPIISVNGKESLATHNIFIVRSSEKAPPFIANLLIDITDQKHTQEALRTKEYIIECATSVISTTELDGKMTFVNPSFLRTWGFECSEEVLGKHFSDFWCVKERLPEIMTALLEKGTWSDEIKAKKSDGTLFDVEVYASIVTNKAGKPIAVMSSSIDITARKQAQNALLERENLLRSTLDSTADGILVVNKAGQVTHSNTRFAHMWQIPKEIFDTHDDAELLSHVLAQLQEPEAFLSRVEQLYDSIEEDFDTLFFKDGRVFDRHSCPLIQNGQIAGRVWSFRDITDRVRTEKALRESEERYRSLFEDNCAVMLLVDPETGNILDANPAACAFYGYAGDQLKRMKISQINMLSEEELFEEMQRAKALQRNHFKFRHRLASGDMRDVEVYAGPVKLHGKKLLCSIIHDVTEQNLLKAQLLQGQKMQAIGTLAGGIAHNFNNLLSVIQGNVSLMLFDEDSNSTNYTCLKTIEKHVRDGAELTHQLLGYARKGRYHVKPLSLNAVVNACADTFGRTKKELLIHRDLAEGVCAVEADQGQIEQVLLNLYVNASEAMERGGTLTLQTAYVTEADIQGKVYHPKPGTYVLLTVSDTGEGMSPEVRDRIFDPFFTTKKTGRGAGLGLASVYGIIKGHGGYIDVESEHGRGTTFRIYLPATDKPVDTPVAVEAKVTKGSGAVLLVDDEPLVLETGAKVLERLGYTVRTAKSGREAVDMFARWKDRIDVVILDLIMPRMDGGQTFDKIRQIDPHIKVLLSSGYSLNGRAKEILERGCNGFIQKPFTMGELSEAMKKVRESR